MNYKIERYSLRIKIGYYKIQAASYGYNTIRNTHPRLCHAAYGMERREGGSDYPGLYAARTTKICFVRQAFILIIGRGLSMRYMKATST